VMKNETPLQNNHITYLIQMKMNNKYRKKKKLFNLKFTLMEVVVSIAILAIGVITSLQITASGTNRMGKAVTRWKVQHMLSQAAEYYLIAGPKEQIPDLFFPYEEYRASCEIGIPDLQEGIETTYGENWNLVKLTIRITDNEGNVVGKIEMDKILRTEDIK